MVASRPQRTEQMFQALKKHILRERHKKKQEQEADAEVERQRKEIEAQQKQNVMTLGENREQMAQLEQVLAQLKDEKHQLFLKLKKVLHEDDVRRRQLVRQQESNDVMDLYGGLYPGVAAPPPPPPVGGHISHLVMQQSYPVADRNTLYKVPPTHTLLPPGSLKRARSPSPPPQPQVSYPQSYVQKPPSSSRVSYQKSSGYGGYYPPPGTTGGNQTAYTYSSPQFVSPSMRNDQGLQGENVPPVPQQAKHPVYMAQPLPRTPINQTYMHSALEHSKPTYSEEKYYVGPIRPSTHVSLHGGAIPIQQPAQGAKTGGITSGFPIRPSSSAPPPHIVSTPSSHGVYVSQPGSGSRLVYSQAGLTPSRYGQREGSPLPQSEPGYQHHNSPLHRLPPQPRVHVPRRLQEQVPGTTVPQVATSGPRRISGPPQPSLIHPNPELSSQLTSFLNKFLDLPTVSPRGRQPGTSSMSCWTPG